MTARPDDDALSWGGDDDPTLDTGVPASVSPSHAGAAAATPAPGDDTAPTAPVTADAAPGPTRTEVTVPEQRERAPMGNTTLIAFGVLVGFYLLFTLGWVIGGLRLRARADATEVDLMLQGSFWLAVFAPALWFGTVLLLTRGARGWVRMVWLIAGVVLLIPWPFLMVGPVVP